LGGQRHLVDPSITVAVPHDAETRESASDDDDAEEEKEDPPPQTCRLDDAVVEASGRSAICADVDDRSRKWTAQTIFRLRHMCVVRADVGWAAGGVLTLLPAEARRAVAPGFPFLGLAGSAIGAHECVTGVKGRAAPWRPGWPQLGGIELSWSRVDDPLAHAVAGGIQFDRVAEVTILQSLLAEPVGLLGIGPRLADALGIAVRGDVPQVLGGDAGFGHFPDQRLQILRLGHGRKREEESEHCNSGNDDLHRSLLVIGCGIGQCECECQIPIIYLRFITRTRTTVVR